MCVCVTRAPAQSQVPGRADLLLPPLPAPCLVPALCPHTSHRAHPSSRQTHLHTHTQEMVNKAGEGREGRAAHLPDAVVVCVGHIKHSLPLPFPPSTPHHALGGTELCLTSCAVSQTSLPTAHYQLNSTCEGGEGGEGGGRGGRGGRGGEGREGRERERGVWEFY